MTAVSDCICLVATLQVNRPLMIGLGGRGPSLPVCPQRYQDVEQVFALLGKPVLISHRVVLVGLGADHPCIDQPLKSIGQCVTSDPQTFHELLEAPHSEECVPEDQNSPGIPDDIDRVGDRAFQMIERFALHRNQSIVSLGLQFTTELVSCKLQPTSRLQGARHD